MTSLWRNFGRDTGDEGSGIRTQGREGKRAHTKSRFICCVYICRTAANGNDFGKTHTYAANQLSVQQRQPTQTTSELAADKSTSFSPGLELDHETTCCFDACNLGLCAPVCPEAYGSCHSLSNSDVLAFHGFQQEGCCS